MNLEIDNSEPSILKHTVQPELNPRCNDLIAHAADPALDLGDRNGAHPERRGRNGLKPGHERRTWTASSQIADDIGVQQERKRHARGLGGAKGLAALPRTASRASSNSSWSAA